METQFQMTRETAKAILLQLANAIVETVQATGERGAPAGSLYMALNARGMSIDTFEQIMSALVDAKRLRKSGHLYYFIGEP